MNRKEVSEFLYRFYQKRSASFLANIYKASITTDTKDIHRARLDVKKILALHDLFEMLAPGSFSHAVSCRAFRPLYRQAGKIREIQVNFLLLDELEQQETCYPAFISWLKESERQAIRKFVREVKKLNEKRVSEVEKQIGEICRHSSNFNLRSKTDSFIRRKAAVIKRLQGNEPGEKEIHKIRQNLKAMAAIATLAHSIRERKQLDTVISALNRTEIMIGNWHDRVVLINAIGVFLKGNDQISPEETAALHQLEETLRGQMNNLELHFMPEVSVVVETVLT